MIWPVSVWSSSSRNLKNLLTNLRFNNTSVNSRIMYPTTACFMTTNAENCIGIALGAPEAQSQGGGFNVMAHLANVNRFIVQSIRNGISTTYLLDHHL